MTTTAFMDLELQMWVYYTAFKSLAFFLQCGYNWIALRLDSAIVDQTLGWRELGASVNLRDKMSLLCLKFV